MTRSYATIAAALGATVFFALATAFKHRSAGLTPDARRPGAGALGRFLVATARHPLWLAGIGADVVGLSLQVTALHIGALAAVQPLMVVALLISLLLNHRFARTRVTAAEIVGGALLVVSIIGFLAVSGASSPAVTGAAQTADPHPAVVIGLAALGLGAGCVFLARRLPRGGAAALLGVTVGMIYACTAALIKSCSNIVLAHGPWALLTSWQPYLLVVAGVAGLVLSQLAFQSGPLRASLPAIATVDPLVSIALGAFVYDEHLRTGAAALVGELVCLTVMCGAVFWLSRVSSATEPGVEEGRRAATEVHPVPVPAGVHSLLPGTSQDAARPGGHSGP